MAAAIAARQGGCSVVLFDEQPVPGGQIYRAVERASPSHARLLGTDYQAGSTLAAALRASGARYEAGAAVWEVTRERTLHYRRDGAVHRLQAERVILCTGALERPMPIPGWTLPGVMTAGAAQILLKSAGAVPAAPVVLAGCGPLLYLLAWQLRRAGAPIRALVDTSDRRMRREALTQLPAALREWRVLAKGVRLLASLRASGVPVFSGARELAIDAGPGHGVDGDGSGDIDGHIDGEARAICFTGARGRERIEAPLILLHQGVVPNTHVTMALRAEHRWDDGQLCWIPITDDTGQLSSAPGIHVAGDGAGIVGAQACAVSGRIAGLAAAAAVTGAAPSSELPRLLARLRRTRDARRFLEYLYRPAVPLRVPADEVVVCRCEEVKAGELRALVRAGCDGPNQMKAFTRCGMGPCQGRQCSLTVSELIAAERGVGVDQVGYLRIRPPLKPVTLGEIAG
ncbi:MAG: NAD(P)/FAD-dependent oxidoreductase [Burkholderiaceae bacterium]